MNNFDLDLSGSWLLEDSLGEFHLETSLPGNVHLALLEADLIPDPFLYDNERKVQWISERDWTYSRTLEIESGSPLLEEGAHLKIDRVDTLATLSVNQKEVFEFDNAHKSWRIPLHSILHAGSNQISLLFRSPVLWVNEKAKAQHLPEWKGPLEIAGRAHLRKASCNFGWDWGPVLTTSGVLGNLHLENRFGNPSLENVYLRQEHFGDELVVLKIEAPELNLDPAMRLHCKVLDPTGSTTFNFSFQSFESHEIHIAIPNPMKWWCNELGEAHLYHVDLEIRTQDGSVLDQRSDKIGLRTIKLVTEKDEWGESFRFEINGVPFFAKGANWIPADAIFNRMKDTDYESLLQSSVDANMNMIRIWGGGIYETEIFYNLCDRLGLLVWQDFMFACSSYPANDPAFLANVKGEAEQQVRRLRNRTCIALWCGNNELEQGLVGKMWTKYHMAWSDYDKLFEDLLPEVTGRLDPDRDYWPASPHTPGNRKDFNNPDVGDAHLWDVWHKKKPFEWYRTAYHRFCAEFGFQSFPEPKVVHRFTEEKDRSVNSDVMELHQRSPVGNSLIMHYMKDWFNDPEDFDETLWLSQILQGLAIKYAVEHWRRNMPRCMGTLYWQLNDCWPVASWSSIDYFHNWKALHYDAKRFYAPLLISCVENVFNRTMEVFISNDRTDSFDGVYHWRLETFKGDILASSKLPIHSEALSSKSVDLVELKDHASFANEDVIFFTWLEDRDAKIISDNFATFVKPKDLRLENADLDISIIASQSDSYIATISAQKPAMWVWLSLDKKNVRFSNNFFSLRSGESKEVEIWASGLSLAEIKNATRLHQLRS